MKNMGIISDSAKTWFFYSLSSSYRIPKRKKSLYCTSTYIHTSLWGQLLVVVPPPHSSRPRRKRVQWFLSLSLLRQRCCCFCLLLSSASTQKRAGPNSDPPFYMDCPIWVLVSYGSSGTAFLQPTRARAPKTSTWPHGLPGHMRQFLKSANRCRHRMLLFLKHTKYKNL